MIENKKTEGEAFKEFINNWNTQFKDVVITYKEFKEFFKVFTILFVKLLTLLKKDLYCTFERDENFELMMNRVWGLK